MSRPLQTVRAGHHPIPTTVLWNVPAFYIRSLVHECQYRNVLSVSLFAPERLARPLVKLHRALELATTTGLFELP